MTEEINNMINKFCDSVKKRISQYELEKENAELKSYSQRMENQRENYYKEYLRLEQENKELKEEIQFHNKENSNLLAERNAAQIGYDETREVIQRYRSALEEIKNDIMSKEVVCTECIKIAKRIDEVLNHEA